MYFHIVNDKKLAWGHSRKVMFKLIDGSLNYDDTLSIEDISRLHFITGELLRDFYCKPT